MMPKSSRKLPSFQCGTAPAIDPEAEIEKVVELAKKAEVAIIVIELNGWTSKHVAKEAKLGAASIILGPTTNIQRVVERSVFVWYDSCCIRWRTSEQRARSLYQTLSIRSMLESTWRCQAGTNGTVHTTCHVGALSQAHSLETIKARVRKVLELVQKSAKGASEILAGDGEGRTDEREEDKVLMRSLAAQSVVLLKLIIIIMLLPM
ncbi:hypothetical protein CPB86DRAFT_814537 [Serendipita vermifera]|nr:hypothetical protein CPB86DRAFT_814537 [Serendipita vermifera]